MGNSNHVITVQNFFVNSKSIKVRYIVVPLIATSENSLTQLQIIVSSLTTFWAIFHLFRFFNILMLILFIGRLQKIGFNIIPLQISVVNVTQHTKLSKPRAWTTFFHVVMSCSNITLTYTRTVVNLARYAQTIRKLIII